MNRYARLIRLAVLIGLCLVCAGGMHWYNYGYLPWEHVPDCSFPVEALLIDESVFPLGWRASDAGPRPPANAPLDHYNSIERIELFFYTHNGIAFQEVHCFASVRGAVREFKRQKSTFFPEGWVVPAELPYQSSSADQFYLACGVEGSIQMCRAIWRYEKYFVKFNTHMSPEFMTYADLGRVLKAIDDRLAFYIGQAKGSR